MSDSSQPENKKEKSGSGNLYWIYGIILLFILFSFFLLPDRQTAQQISEKEFFEKLVDRKIVDKVVIVNEKVAEVYLTTDALKSDEYKQKAKPGFLGNVQPAFTFRIVAAEPFVEGLKKANINYYADERPDYIGSLFSILIPILILIAIWMFFIRRIGSGVGGSQIFNIGKSKASLFDKENRVKITFSDVAGLEEAKQEVMEIVDFLKAPARFTRLGGHIPKGVLLVGPPGTGKTLLAKAVAGEAGVPFFSLSGSDFVEMFVGVGAARVRDLFKQAKDKAPCIIFIDEIDAIGRSRGRMSMTGGNDERENTLNQLLVEMDGFNTDSGVIMMAATNRPDVLDNALQRPGRFDRLISVDRPDLKEREEIFKVHLKHLKTDEGLDLSKLAAQTPGFVGADIMNVCNEAALIAARKEDKISIDMKDFQDALDRVIGGLEKKNKVILPEEKRVIAYHEAGHALAGWFLEFAHPLIKVSIIPRGVATLGFAQYLPREQYLNSTEQLFDEMCVSLGGRAAETLIFNRITTGALSDLERVTKLAYAMVTIYGMNEKVGNISYYDPYREEMAFTKPYSEALSETIDTEVRALIAKAFDRVLALLREKEDLLRVLAQELLAREVIFQDDVERILGKRPFASAAAAQEAIALLNNNGNAYPAESPVATSEGTVATFTPESSENQPAQPEVATANETAPNAGSDE
jgi:AFG3 family protein